MKNLLNHSPIPAKQIKILKFRDHKTGNFEYDQEQRCQFALVWGPVAMHMQ